MFYNIMAVVWCLLIISREKEREIFRQRNESDRKNRINKTNVVIILSTIKKQQHTQQNAKRQIPWLGWDEQWSSRNFKE